jgi:hypothetical protein
MLTDADSARKIAANQLQTGAPFITSEMKVMIAKIRIGIAVDKTILWPKWSAAFDQRGEEITVTSAATAVSEPAIAYLPSTDWTKRMIARASIAIGKRAINPADAILFAPGVLKSSEYVLNNY